VKLAGEIRLTGREDRQAIGISVVRVVVPSG